jgi:hypothetical protein
MGMSREGKMLKFARVAGPVLALAAVLLFATGAFADSFTLTFSGTAPDGTSVSGTLDLTATAEGGGAFAVTSITDGSLTLEGSSYTVSGVTPLDGSPSPENPAYDAYYMCDSPVCGYHYFGYDDLVFPSASDVVDDGGLLFYAGLGQPADLYCSSSGSCYLGVWIGSGSVLHSLFPSGGNNTVDPDFEDYAVTISESSSSVPEPSTSLLLGVGLALLMMAGFGRRVRLASSPGLA